MNGSPVIRRTTWAPDLASFVTSRARATWVSCLTVLADAAVDDLDIRVDQAGLLGEFGDDNVSLTQQVSGAHGEEAGVARAPCPRN